jgi:hypothetical protein
MLRLHRALHELEIRNLRRYTSTVQVVSFKDLDSFSVDPVVA